uniref:Wsv294-like protein n=1 Tax=Metopaulias depressus WSSV-like virus TaxID=1675544 RepID=A0A0K0VLP3_9VIRU|nr:wsv294-like protein [Metopaulias depressus WSSV-like virus]
MYIYIPFANPQKKTTTLHRSHSKMTSKVNLTIEIPDATNIEVNPPPKTPSKDIPFSPFSATNAVVIDMEMEDTSFPSPSPTNDNEVVSDTCIVDMRGEDSSFPSPSPTCKIIDEETVKKIDEFNGGMDVVGIRSDVPTSEEDDLNEIVQSACESKSATLKTSAN